MKRAIRVVLIIGVLALIVVGGAQLLRSQGTGSADEQASPIQDEAVVEVGDLAVTVTGTGPLTPIHDVNLAFETTGVVQDIPVEEGQTVQKGDVLARLDTTDLEAAVHDAEIAFDAQQADYDAQIAPPRPEDIAAAQAALNAARAQVAAAAEGPSANDLEIGRLQVELTRNDLWQQQMQRDARLEIPPEFRGPLANVEEVQLNSGLQSSDYNIFIAQQNYQELLNTGPDAGPLASANAQMVAAQVALDRLLNGPSDLDLQLAETQLRMAELGVEQARLNLSQASLTAPFDGVVARINLVVGELPPEEDPAMELIDSSSYYVDLPIDETDIVSVEVGQPVTLDFDALPGADITGTVTRVATTPTRVDQLVTYTVRVTLNPTDQPVRVGMSATATIVTNQLEGVLLVPNRFIRIDRQTQQAYVTIQRDDGAFEEIPIVLGLRNATTSQIVSGLQAGQRVVLLPRATFNPIAGG